MANGDLNLATTLLLVIALLLALAVLAQILSVFTSACVVAPAEITTFIDAADFSVQENESYDADIAKVTRLEDKMRLGRLLREIQKCGDDLREELNRLLVDEGGARLRSSARLLWAAKRGRLEEKLRRLDLLRMRFLVVYMGLVASKGAPEQRPRDLEKMEREVPKMAPRPSLPHALTESITKKQAPLRRLSTQAMGHNDSVGNGHRQGWAGVVQELQRSPRMHKRHASIEMSMAMAPARLGGRV
jgi:hypothetical protein